MKLIVGLGNPGDDYNKTRHNIGFSFVDYYLSKKFNNVTWNNKFNGLYFQTVINDNKVIFLKPQTFMNLSGLSVRKIIDYFNIDISDILVISDDLDLNIGNYKLKMNGSCGGHNGLRDIENNLNTSEYKRLKIGISKNSNIDTKDYVLGKISKEDNLIYSKLFDELVEVIDDYFVLPFNDLMCKYNRKNR